MTDSSIYHDIETRTGGDIYIGVVGPVRTGKSTFIKRFMDTLVLPNMGSEYKKERAGRIAAIGGGQNNNDHRAEVYPGKRR